jgi:murein DD-endopeptidase MepM/ murein hydrolase activator NlpD
VFGTYRGRLVSGFGQYRPSAPAQKTHAGWDVAAGTGTYGRALGLCEVVRVRDNDSVSGYHQEITVWYESARAFVLYGHVLRGIPHRVGDQLDQGDIVASVGTSYDAMGTLPHFHVQAWKTRQGMLSYSAGLAISPGRLEVWYQDGRK